MKKLLIEVGHPAHVHQFKNLYWELSKLQWDIKFVAKDKDIVIYLLNHYKIPYYRLAITSPNIAKKILSIPTIDYKYNKLVRSFKPDFIISRVSPYSGHVSFINRIPHICFTDTENVELLDLIAAPFADFIFTSGSFKRNYGKKHFRYRGSHELAYLHPNRYNPDPTVLKELNLGKKDKYFILRFVNWSAHHDIGQKGLNSENKIKLVNELKQFGKVFITAEGDLPDELKSYKIAIAPEKMHDVLNFASLYIGESSTMAEEAAVLGTPSIYISTSAHIFGIIEELQKAELLTYYHPNDFSEAIKEVKDFLNDIDIKESKNNKLKEYLGNRIDVTEFMVWLILNYPDSIDTLRTNPNYPNKFI